MKGGRLSKGQIAVVIVIAVVLTIAIINFPYVGLLLAIALAIFVTLFACAFVSVLVHELGHALAAWLFGFRIYLISVLNFAVYHRRHRMKTPAGSMGFVMALKRTPTKFQTIGFLIGGPMASLVFGVSLILISKKFTVESALGTEGLAYGIMRLAGWYNVITGLYSLVPFQHKETLSDGKLVLDLIRKPQEFLDQYHGLAIYYASFDERPRDWREEDMEALKVLNLPDYWAHLMRFWSTVDQGKLRESVPHIQHCYDSVLSSTQPSSFDAAVCFEMSMVGAKVLKDRALSDSAYEAGIAREPTAENRLGADIAREWVWGDRAKASTMADQAMKNARENRYLSPALRDHAIDWYLRLVDRLEPQQAPNSSASYAASDLVQVLREEV